MILQRWHEIAFFHWSCEPGVLRPFIPPHLLVDTFEGNAWITLTPFLLKEFRPPGFPRSLSLTFPEMNLRTYVIGPEGPAIWFFSLDAARAIAVWGARAVFGLPYYRADMAVDFGEKENFYISSRAGGAHAVIRIEKQSPILAPSELDLFLTARFRLYSTLRGRLMTATVEHPPWELNRIRILEFAESVRRVMRVEFPSKTFLAHHSSGVDSHIGRPRLSQPGAPRESRLHSTGNTQ